MEISIAKDFSQIPGARFPNEGDYSGQDFRTKVLLPALRNAISNEDKLVVILDGTAGLGTSFLEEAFGGLIREDRLDYELLTKTLEFISEEDPEYIEEIDEYMKEAYEQTLV